jgi:hypothetical protein
MRSSAFAIITGVAAVVAFSAASHAQKREITTEEVKDYFAHVQRDVTDLVRKGDVAGIRQWTARNLADDARFKVMIEAMHEDNPKMWSVIDLGKADAEQLQAELGQGVVRSIQDYSLRIELRKAVSHGADAATVTTAWSDSGKLAPPAATAAEQVQGKSGQTPQTETQSRTIEIKRMFECDQLLVRDEGRLKVSLSGCKGQVHF